MQYVQAQLKIDNFTFETLGVLFGLLHVEEYYSKQAIELLDNYASKKSWFKAGTIINILSQTPSQNIDKDIEALHNYTKYKDIAENSIEKIVIQFNIEDKYGKYRCYFMNGRAIEVLTTDIFHLPSELYDNFEDSIITFGNLDLKDPTIETSITFFNNDPKQVHSLNINKK